MQLSEGDSCNGDSTAFSIRYRIVGDATELLHYIAAQETTFQYPLSDRR